MFDYGVMHWSYESKGLFQLREKRGGVSLFIWSSSDRIKLSDGFNGTKFRPKKDREQFRRKETEKMLLA